MIDLIEFGEFKLSTAATYDFAARHPEYQRNIKTWEYLTCSYEGLGAWSQITANGLQPKGLAKFFLPKHPDESEKNWRSRFNQTEYPDFYAKGIKRMVDLAFQDGIDYAGVESPFYKNRNSIAENGYNFEYFIRELARIVLLYGIGYVLIDSELGINSSIGDYQKTPPYFVVLNPMIVVNWSIEEQQLQFLVTRQESSKLMANGRWQGIIEYRYYYPGGCDVYEVEPGENSKVEQVREVGRFLTGLNYIPIFMVKGTYAEGITLPLRNIADKNRVYYQNLSYHRRKVALCCNPVPVIKDAARSPDDALIIGPDSYINIVDPNGSFSWQEPLALSLKESRDDLIQLQESLNDDIAQFLLSPVARQTATTTEVMVQPVESSLESFLVVFLNGIDILIAGYNRYCGSDSVTLVDVSSDIYDTSEVDSQFVFALLALLENGVYSAQQVRDIIETRYRFFREV